MRYFFHLAYQGSAYHGWQRQVSAVSVQQVLEERLSEVLSSKTQVYGCGRTDAGVHAAQYFAHFDSDILFTDELMFRLNKRLPSDISIFEYIPVHPSAHVRYDALERTYDYFIHLYKDAHLYGRSAWYDDQSFDLTSMQAALALLPSHKDFRTFCRRPDKLNTTICHISAAQLFTNHAGNRIRIQITADRFLSGMMRLLIGELLDVGRGRLSVATFQNYLINKPALPYYNQAYPQGLYLTKISYPYLVRACISDPVENLMQGDWLAVS